MGDDSGPAVFRIVPTTVAVPLLILGLGVWEMRRGDTDQGELEVQRGYLSQMVGRMEAWIAAKPHRAMEVQFRRQGQLCAGPYAVQNAREAPDDVGTALAIGRWRRVLPPVTIVYAGLTAALSVLARADRASRDAMVRGFSVLHRLMPSLPGLQVVLVAACAVTVVLQLRHTMALFTPDPIPLLG